MLLDKLVDQVEQSPEKMMRLARELWPLNRSIMGDGYRESLKIIDQILSFDCYHEFPSGDTVFDWEIPEEWVFKSARVSDEYGNIILDSSHSNLHIVGYSVPVDIWLSYDEFCRRVHTLDHLPDAIPYVTSYYHRDWGLCATKNFMDGLDKRGKYHVEIESSFRPGRLIVGEKQLGDKCSKDEIFFSTYLCHPSLANNELSGPVVTTFLARILENLSDELRYKYRFVVLPETIGSIAYLSKFNDDLQRSVKGGFVLTCIGDDRCYSYLPSRSGGTLADRAAKLALRTLDSEYHSYSWLDRGSDERQYCAPGIDLPVCSVMRSKYGTYPEYHTSMDSLGEVVTEDGLKGGLMSTVLIVALLEANFFPIVTKLCEPQLSKYGLYNVVSRHRVGVSSGRKIINFLSYCDGEHDLLDIAEECKFDAYELLSISESLLEKGLIKKHV